MNRQVVICPEIEIYRASLDDSREDHTAFIYALNSGKVFKENNLSPVYFLDFRSRSIHVTSEECMQSLFH